MDDHSEDGPLTGLYWKVSGRVVSADDEEQEQEQYDYSFSSHQIGKEASHPNQHSTVSCSERGFTLIAEKFKNSDSAAVRIRREKTVPKLTVMCHDALRKECRARMVLPGHLTRPMAMVHPEDSHPARNSIADESSKDSSGTTNMAEGDYGETMESSLMVFDLRASSSASVYGSQAWRPLPFLPNTQKSIPDTRTTCKQVLTTLRVHLQSRRVAQEAITGLPDRESQRAGSFTEDKTPTTRSSLITYVLSKLLSFISCCFVMKSILRGDADEDRQPEAADAQDGSKPVSGGAPGARGCTAPDSPVGRCTIGKDEDKTLLKADERETRANSWPDTTDMADEDKTPLKTNERETQTKSLPDTTDMAVQVNWWDRTDKGVQVNWWDRTDKAVQVNWWDRTDKGVQVNWWDRTDKGVQVNLLDMKASEREPTETDFPQPQTSLGTDAAAGGGVQEEGAVENSGLPPFAEQIPRGELAAMRPERADLEDAEVRTERSTGLAFYWDLGRLGVLLQYLMAKRALQDNLPTGCNRHSEPIVDLINFVLPIGEDTDDDHSVLKKNQAKTDAAQPPQHADCKPSSSERKPFKRLTQKDAEKYGETYPTDTNADGDTVETVLKESAKRQPDMKSHEKGGSEDEETLLSRHYSTSRIPPGFREWVVSMLRSSGAAAGAAGDGKSARCDADFRSEWRRLATFDQYQPPEDVFVLPIAHNGFFLRNSSSDDPGGLLDSVECAFCGVTVPVRMFQKGRVEEVHRRVSPDCGFLSGRCREDNVAISDSDRGSEGRSLGWMAAPSQGAGPAVDTPSLPSPSLAPSLQQQTEALQTDSCPEPADSGTDLAPDAEAVAAAAHEARGHPDGALLISAGSSKPRPDHSAGRPPTHNSTPVPTLPEKPNTAQPRPPASSSAAASSATDASATTPSPSTSASATPTPTTTTSTPPPAASSVAFSSATSSAAAATASTATSTATPSVSAAPSSRSTSAAAAAAAAPAVVTSATTSAAASATQSGSLPPISGDSRTQSDNLSVSSTPATIEAAAARVEEGSRSSSSQGQRTGNQGTAAPAGNPDARSSNSSSSSSSRSGESGTEGDNGAGNGEGSSTENETERQVVTYEDLGIFAQQPKRPDLAVTQIRINTFDQWPHEDSHPADQMAEAGFYYTGHQDLVRCFFCKGGLKTWERSDQPWVEHCRWFPRCPFVRLAKGQRFVDVVQTLNSAANQPTIFEQQVIDEVNRLDREERRQAASQPSTQQAEGGSAATVDPVSEVLKKEGLRDWVDIAEDGLRSIADRLEDEQDDIRHDTLCKVCQSGDVNVLFLPCGHLVTCAQCAPALKRCAMCRQPVKGSVRVRMDDDLDDGHDTQEEGADTRGATSTS